MDPQISLKGTSIWIYKSPKKCSYILRKVLSLRDTAKSNLSSDAGAPICSSKNDPIISQSGLSLHDRVANILNVEWRTLMEFRQNFNTNTHFNLQRRDEIRWQGKLLKNNRLSDLWKVFRQADKPVSWAESVWHNMHCQFPILAQFKVYGVVNNDTCYFCTNSIENSRHLFLECPYIQHLLRMVINGGAHPFRSVGLLGWENWMALTRMTF